MKIINVISTDVNVYDMTGEYLLETYKGVPGDESPYLSTFKEEDDRLEGILSFPVKNIHYKKVMRLPAEEEGTLFIVPNMVRMYESMRPKGRRDLISPDTSKRFAVRDKHGAIIGTKQFIS